ncbi:S-norcoclaurine synthase 2-like [Cucurbita moschata]|uniref:S-norcoclaurine synthase 2-like n=1 Tax=Cucurbita moschata TaxID=3662 RepID=A0A6J1FY33_CUCMO|nr:S-norcoclaurine synthase 2-like [Cucurbita moschata]
MLGKLSHESVIQAPATVAWQLYGGFELARLVENRFSNLIQKIEVVEGDGGEGTVLNLIFPPGVGRFSSFKEKFTRIDNENRIKETEVVEGGFLDIGFTLYRVRLKMVENGDDSCIVESTIEYEIKEEAAANASLVNIQFFIDIAQTENDHLLHNKQPKDA